MNRPLRRMAGAITALTLAVSFGIALSAANPTRAHAACTVPVPPASDELTGNPDGSISLSLVGSAGATSYNIYRGLSSGGEAATPVANSTSTIYTDKNLGSSTNTYFYEFTAVNACGESARSAEDSMRTPPPAPTGGSVAGVASGNSEVYYRENAMFGGGGLFQKLRPPPRPPSGPAGA